MPNEKRQGVLREARATTGFTGQDTRLSGNRAAHIGRGSYINYQKDLGISASEDRAALIREQEAAFNAEIKQKQQQVNAAKSDINKQYQSNLQQIQKANSSIPGFDSALNTYWNKTKSSFVPINVVHAGKIEGTYYLPKASATTLAEKDGISASWSDDGRALNIDVKSDGHYMGEELHDALSTAQSSVYSKWYIASAPKIKAEILNASDKINQASGVLNTSYIQGMSQIGTAQGAIDSAVNKRKAEWDKIHSDYQAKKEKIQSIFANLQVEKK